MVVIVNLGSTGKAQTESLGLCGREGNLMAERIGGDWQISTAI